MREKNRKKYSSPQCRKNFWNKEIEKMVEDIDNRENDRHLVKATNCCTKNVEKTQTSKHVKLTVEPNEILKITIEHFKTKFRNDNKNQYLIHYDCPPRPLSKPMSAKEERESFKHFTKNKAAEEDGLHVVLLKKKTKHNANTRPKKELFETCLGI